MVQPLPIICTVRPTTVSTATTPAKASAKQGVIHATTCLALTRLRLGACQQPMSTWKSGANQAQPFGTELRQNALRLVTAPGIQLAVLFPQFPQPFDLPADPQQHQGFLYREQRLWHIGQHNRPIG